MTWKLSFAVLLFVVAASFLSLLPNPQLLTVYDYSQAIYDRENKLLRLTLTEDDKYRIPIALDQIDPRLIEATLLQEDQYFFQHWGINPIALMRAGWQTYIEGQRRVGASTITMQLARLRFGLYTRSFFGKLRQIYEALRIEFHYSKDEILTAYFHLAPYGGNIEGLAAASAVYFDKSAKDLRLDEILSLAVIPKSPRRRGPRADGTVPAALLQARQELYVRWQEKYPSRVSVERVLDDSQVFQARSHLPFRAPHFVNKILEEGINDLAVHSTLDWSIQKIMERQLQLYVKRNKQYGVFNASALLLDYRDMGVRALVGSADFFDQDIEGQVNGTSAKRSPGSSLKPFIYGLAMDQGLLHPRTMLKDAPIDYGGYSPGNFDSHFGGPLSAEEALIRSRNVPAIQIAAKLKDPSLYEFLQQAGIKKLLAEDYYGLALVLGGAELTMEELVSLYALLANGGSMKHLRYHSLGKRDRGKRLLSEEASFLTLKMLQKNPHPGRRYDYRATRSAQAVAWKTGTSYAYRDAWSIAVVGPYVLAVWIGNFDGRSNPVFIGRDIAAPLMFQMIDAFKGEKSDFFDHPFVSKPGVKKVAVCALSGNLPSAHCPHRSLSWFIPGVSTIQVCSIHREVFIDLERGQRSCVGSPYPKRRQVLEFWPSDMLALFRHAGVPRREPPGFIPECSLTDFQSTGLDPKIISPKNNVAYQLRLSQDKGQVLALTAMVDADVKTLYWFVDGSYLGSAKTQHSFDWLMDPGQHVIRVIDDHGRAASADLQVQVIK
jgi:penicillin-binding protein 1C